MLSLLVLWGRLLKKRGTLFALIGAGLAIALKEPVLSVAGCIAIFAGHMYSVGDRIEINNMKGDVIDIGMFYTRLMGLANRISADQATGRLVRISMRGCSAPPSSTIPRTYPALETKSIYL